MMGRLALAVVGAVSAALVVLLLVNTRGGGGGDEPESGAGAGRPVESARPATPQAPSAGEPAADPAGAQSAAPAPAAAPEARKEVAAERMQPGPLPSGLAVDRAPSVASERAARKSYQSGDFEAALASAEAALGSDPESSSARILATLAACELGNATSAAEHAKHLDDTDRARVASRCESLGVAPDPQRATGAAGEGERPTSRP